MSAKQEYRRTSHSVYLCDYHLILTTKYRHPVVTPELWKYLYGKLLEVTHHYPTIYVKEANHDKDHVHLLLSIPPQMSVGSVVRLLKTNTAKNLKKTFPILNKYFWGTDGILSQQLEWGKKSLNVILQTKENLIQVKELRSLTRAMQSIAT